MSRLTLSDETASLIMQIYLHNKFGYYNAFMGQPTEYEPGKGARLLAQLEESKRKDLTELAMNKFYKECYDNSNNGKYDIKDTNMEIVRS